MGAVEEALDLHNEEGMLHEGYRRNHKMEYRNASSYDCPLPNLTPCAAQLNSRVGDIGGAQSSASLRLKALP